MDARCILCDARMSVTEEPIASQEDPDLVCSTCRSLSEDDRRALRDEAVERMRSKPR
jgi:hypothetical protein